MPGLEISENSGQESSSSSKTASTLLIEVNETRSADNKLSCRSEIYSATAHLPWFGDSANLFSSSEIGSRAGSGAPFSSKFPVVNADNITKSAARDGISPAGVDQGNVGDCFFESALASVANSKQGQETIKDMIKHNNDGSYTVTFPGDKSSPINVTQEDLTANKNNGHVVDKADWARVIETAFLKYDHAEQYNSGLNNKIQKLGIPPFGNVVDTDKSLHLLTGKGSSTDSLSIWNLDNRELTIGRTSVSNVGKDLEAAFSKGESVTAGASAGILSDLGQNDARPLVGEHVYSVLSYDPKTQEVVVRNPWGSNFGTDLAQDGSSKDGITSLGDGKLKMSLDTFTKRFTDVNFSGENYLSHDLKNTSNDLATQVANLGKVESDLVLGNYSKLGKDLKNYGNSTKQTTMDVLYDATDIVERVAKTELSNDTKMLTGTLHKADELAKNVLNKLNPFNW